jgi:hypothetical protein
MKIVQKFIDVVTASTLSDETDLFINEFIHVTSIYNEAMKELPSGCSLRGEVALEWEVPLLVLRELGTIVEKANTSEHWIGSLHEPSHFNPYWWMQITDKELIRITLNTCEVPLFIYTGQEYQEINR